MQRDLIRIFSKRWLLSGLVACLLVLISVGDVFAYLGDDQRRFHELLIKCDSATGYSTISARNPDYRDPRFIYDYLAAMSLNDFLQLKPQVAMHLFKVVEESQELGRAPDRFDFNGWTRWFKDSSDPHRNAWVQAFSRREVSTISKATEEFREIRTSSALSKASQNLTSVLNFLLVHGLSGSSEQRMNSKLWSEILTLSLRFTNLIVKAQESGVLFELEDLSWVTSFLNLMEHNASDGKPEHAAMETTLLDLFHSIFINHVKSVDDPACCTDSMARLSSVRRQQGSRSSSSDSVYFTSPLRAPDRIISSVDESGLWSGVEGKSFGVLVTLSETVPHPQVQWKKDSVSVQLPKKVYGRLEPAEIERLFNDGKIHEAFSEGIWLASGVSPGLFVFYKDEEPIPDIGTHKFLAVTRSYEGGQSPLRVFSKENPISYHTVRDLKMDLGCADNLRASPRPDSDDAD